MVDIDGRHPSHAAFDCFLKAQTCKDVLGSFSTLCRHLEIDAQDHWSFYPKLKERLNYWKAKALWAKLDKRSAHADYGQGQVCKGNKCLVLGAGPCGLRTAIELSLLGAKVVLLEKRETFSRNNVLHLWPYTIHDLRGLAAKKFYGRFCSGSLDHISIRQLQLILLKVALLLGVDIYTGVEFKGLKDPQVNDMGVTTGWRAELRPETHPVKSFQFDVFISAGGGNFVPNGFRRKELRGKLAIGITANFVNRHTAVETQVAEISGVARIYNQKFFKDLQNETGIDLENIVYYKDDTHYFVMTAKKKSLVKKGVLKQDHGSVDELLSPANVDQDALLHYAHDAAYFSTSHHLPDMEFARNHRGCPDVAMFDFTCMYRAENASMVKERLGRRLLVGLVGDCLVEPFWPLGTGIARGFLAAFDAAWMVRRWGMGDDPLDVIAERESVYQLLSQTTPENTSKNYGSYSLNPKTRYPNINLKAIKTGQVQHLYDSGDPTDTQTSSKRQTGKGTGECQDSPGSCQFLLRWCQQHTAGYQRVRVTDLAESWRSGLALCALIHRFRPHLIDFSSLVGSDAVCNNQLAFDVAEEELGISPIMSGTDMAAPGQPDKLSMVLYLTQFYNVFTEAPPTDCVEVPGSTASLSRSSVRSVTLFLSKLKRSTAQRQKRRLSVEQASKEGNMGGEEEDGPPSPLLTPSSSDLCYFCGQRVYILERVSTEGKFFHRSCFTCNQCGATLRLGDYVFSEDTGKFCCAQHSEELPLTNGEECVQHLQPEPAHQDHIRTLAEPSESNGGHVLPQFCSGLLKEDQSSGSLIAEDQERPTGLTVELQNWDVSNAAASKEQPYSSPAQYPVVTRSDPEADLRPNQVMEHGKTTSEPTDPTVILPCLSGEGHPQAGLPVPAARSLYLSFPVGVNADKGPCDATPALPPVPKPRARLLKTPEAAVLISSEDQEGNEKQEPKEDVEGEVMRGLAAADQCSKAALRKLQLSAEERSQLSSSIFGKDSDSEVLAPALPTSPKPPRTLLEPEDQGGTWANSLTDCIRQQKHRRSFRRKDELAAKVQAQASNPKARSKFSPWNLSSPRLVRDHRFLNLGVYKGGTGATSPPVIKLPDVDDDDANEDEEEEDDDDGEENESTFCNSDVMHPSDWKMVSAVPVTEQQKVELQRMRTIERQAKLYEIQRFHKAQSIQRRLEEIEVTFKELEEKGVVLERALREEAGSSEMINQWIELVHQKNALVSEESDLMVASRQLELEDKQSRLDAELRRYLEVDESKKTAEQREKEERVLQEMLEVVNMRNSLVAFLEEQRLKEASEQLQGVSIVEPKRAETGAAQVHWA
nr:F-actin-monooxygenase mical1-like isoform X2 [Paramormyrops kingsleyae]